MATTYLTRTQVAGNRQIFTQSFWCKIADPSGTQTLAGTFNDSSNYNYCYLDGGNLKLQWKQSGSVTATLDTNRKFRDTNAFYNIVYAVDTTQGTAANRIKLYINGVQETSFSTATYPSQNRYTEINDNGTTQYVGSIDGSQQYVDGVMSYVAQIDGTQELPGIFGETDSTTGEWEIKTSITPSVAWGNNGFLILKNGNSLTDESSNSNNFTLSGGTLTKTEDCPSNVFATINPLLYQVASQYASVPRDGNTTTTSGSGNAWGTLLSTIGASSGKYYCEAKCVTLGTYAMVGICDMNADAQNSSSAWYLGATAGSAQYGYNSNDGNIYTNDSNSSYGTSFTTGDIMGIAMDLDNSKLYFSKNGTWQNSGVPTSGSTGTGAVSITADKTYGFGFSSYASTVWYINFGNGYFSTGAVASAGTNASGNGIFEYDTPTGYTALSTKGLNL